MSGRRLITIFLALQVFAFCFGENPADTIFVESPVAPDMARDSIENVKPAVPMRKITPVDVDDHKPQVTLHYYDKHGNPLPEPVKFLAVLDTVTKPKSKPVYPLLNGGTIGVNFGDALFMACGQKFGSVDIWGDISLYNWLFPVVELGVGFADNTPLKGNFTYITSPSFYSKIGFNYNFMYKSDPAYQLFAGVRFGYTNFKFNVEGVTISDGYWNEAEHFSMKGMRASAVYGELLAGIKVKIVGNFSLGWNARFHIKLHEKSKSISTPWYIPGYGTSSPFQIAVNAMYSFGQKKRDPEETASN